MNRIMGLDIGQKTIGIALSDRLGWIAQPLVTVRRSSWATDLATLRDLVTQYRIQEMVIGLPKNMDGSIGKQAEYVYLIAGRIQDSFPEIYIQYIDERLTTVIAERALIEGHVRRKRRKEIIDQQAAVLILQTYLEKQRFHTHAPTDPSDFTNHNESIEGLNN